MYIKNYPKLINFCAKSLRLENANKINGKSITPSE